MKTIEIEPGVPFQEFSVRLEDVDFILYLQWNFRRSVWGLSIFDADRELIHSISSLLVGAAPNNINLHNSSAPRGIFMLIDTAGEDQEASLNSLGGRHQLTFLNFDEYSSLTQAG